MTAPTSAASAAGYDPAEVRCAVHFVRAGTRFLYRVSDAAPGPDGAARARPVALGGDLVALAEGDGWAESETAEVSLGVDERGRPVVEGREVLRVWVVAPVADGGPPPGVLSGTLSDALSSPAAPSFEGDVYGSGALLDHVRGMERGLGAVPRLSRTAAAGVGAVLGAGRFTVTGAAFFRPGVPLDPAPVVPEPTATEPLAAAERFTLTYPPPR